MDITKVIATELGIRTSQVEAVIKLIDEGNTIRSLRDTERKHMVD